MTFLGRDYFSPQLIKAFGLKSLGLDFNNAVLPHVQLLDLERSAFPPFVPFYCLSTVNAVAAQFSLLVLQFSTVQQGASPYARVVVDYVDISAQETTGTVRQSIGTQGDIASLTLNQQMLKTDATGETPGAPGQAYTINEIGIYFRNNAAHGIGGNMNLMVNNGGYNRIERARPLAILAPGQLYGIETNTVNIAMLVGFGGRYFVGQ